MKRAIILAALLFALPAAAAPIRASYYGTESGTRTANGEHFMPMGRTAAHRTLPFGTIIRVSYRHRSAECRINDRGPARYTGRSLDLSKGCASAIGMVAAGVATIDMVVVR